MVTKDSATVGLPIREFLFTIDQLAMMLDVTERTVYDSYLFYNNRSVGVRPKDKMMARDISPAAAPKPEWRVTEREFVRWLKVKGFRYHTRGYVT